jgi:hypothetical protein
MFLTSAKRTKTLLLQLFHKFRFFYSAPFSDSIFLQNMLQTPPTICNSRKYYVLYSNLTKAFYLLLKYEKQVENSRNFDGC